MKNDEVCDINNGHVSTSGKTTKALFAKCEIARFRKKCASAVFATVAVHGKKDSRFDEARIAEIRELIKKDTYEFVEEEEVPDDATILQSRFVFTIKTFENPDGHLKARLVILGHIHPEEPRVVKEAPTVIKYSIRLAVAIIAGTGYQIWSRDISQAFLQSEDPLRRTDHFFMRSDLNTDSPMPQDTGGRHYVIGM